MCHRMGLYPENFEQVKTGQKQREYRLYDEKRREIKPGDTVLFYNTETGETAAVVVTALHVFPDFKSCYAQYWEKDFSYCGMTLDEAVEDTYKNWWPKQAEEKYGCVVMDIELAP